MGRRAGPRTRLRPPGRQADAHCAAPPPCGPRRRGRAGRHGCGRSGGRSRTGSPPDPSTSGLWPAHQTNQISPRIGTFIARMTRTIGRTPMGSSLGRGVPRGKGHRHRRCRESPTGDRAQGFLPVLRGRRGPTGCQRLRRVPFDSLAGRRAFLRAQTTTELTSSAPIFSVTESETTRICPPELSIGRAV
jgi:hypothetical protein